MRSPRTRRDRAPERSRPTPDGRGLLIGALGWRPLIEDGRTLVGRSSAMLVALPIVSSIVLAMAPGARQVVQSAPSGAIAVSKDGYVAMLERALNIRGGGLH